MVSTWAANYDYANVFALTGLEPDTHRLTITSGAGFTWIEGVRVYGELVPADETDLQTQPPAEPLSLSVAGVCSPDPDTSRVWWVYNHNDIEVPFTWVLEGTSQAGEGIAAS